MSHSLLGAAIILSQLLLLVGMGCALVRMVRGPGKSSSERNHVRESS